MADLKNYLEYKGYYGSVIYSGSDDLLWGKIEFITDTVDYRAQGVKSLKTEFRNAVNDYIRSCRRKGKAPQKTFRGSFNVRMKPELHKAAALGALKMNTSLNDFVGRAVKAYVEKNNG